MFWGILSPHASSENWKSSRGLTAFLLAAAIAVEWTVAGAVQRVGIFFVKTARTEKTPLQTHVTRPLVLAGRVAHLAGGRGGASRERDETVRMNEDATAVAVGLNLFLSKRAVKNVVDSNGYFMVATSDGGNSRL